MITQALELQTSRQATLSLLPKGKGGLRPVDFLRLIDAARPACTPAQRTHYFLRDCSNDLLERRPCTPVSATLLDLLRHQIDEDVEVIE